MAIALRAAGTGAGSSSSVTSITFTLPAGTTAGDLCLYCLKAGNTGQVISKTGGTGTWPIWQQASDAINAYTWMFGAYVLQPGDTAPTFGWTLASNTVWSLTALTSTTGAVLSVDAWSAELEQQTTVASVTPNAATAAGSGEASVVLILTRGSAPTTLSTSYTWTPPSGWTQDATGFFLSNGTFRGSFSGTCYQLGVGPGPVAPGSTTLTDTGGDTFFWSVAHVLVAESAGSRSSLPQPGGRSW